MMLSSTFYYTVSRALLVWITFLIIFSTVIKLSLSTLSLPKAEFWWTGWQVQSRVFFQCQNKWNSDKWTTRFSPLPTSLFVQISLNTIRSLHNKKVWANLQTLLSFAGFSSDLQDKIHCGFFYILTAEFLSRSFDVIGCVVFQVLSGGVVLQLRAGQRVWLESFKDQQLDSDPRDTREKQIIFNGFLLFSDQ